MTDAEKTEKTPTSNPLRIWVGADACPGAIKEVLYRTANRLKIETTLVANQSMRVPSSNFINIVTVPHGADVADQRIVELMAPGDVVITGDIPLAALVVEKGGVAIGTRGELFNAENVHGRLASRNLMEHLRSAGVETSGPKPQSQKNVQTFSNQLDRTLTKLRKK